jgi:hypothetical protein
MARIRFRDMGTATANRAYPPFTMSRSTSILTGAGTSWAPRALTILQFTAHSPAAPGVGTAVDFQTNQNDNVPVGDIGSPVSLAGAAVSVRGTMNAPVAIVGARDTTQYTIRELLTGAPTSQVTRNALSYVCSAGDEDVSIYSFGQSVVGIFTATNPIFLRPASQTQNAAEGPAQIIWPTAGKLRYFIFVNIGGNWDAGVNFELRLNGIVQHTFTPTAGINVYTDFATSLAVTPGALMSWRAVRTAGVINPTVAIIWGLKANA